MYVDIYPFYPIMKTTGLILKLEAFLTSLIVDLMSGLNLRGTGTVNYISHFNMVCKIKKNIFATQKCGF